MNVKALFESIIFERFTIKPAVRKIVLELLARIGLGKLAVIGVDDKEQHEVCRRFIGDRRTCLLCATIDPTWRYIPLVEVTTVTVIVSEEK